MNLYTHVTYEVYPKKGPVRLHHNNACFASVINGERPEKVVYSPTIFPWYALVNTVGYGNIMTSPDATTKWTEILNQMFPAKTPIFSAGPGLPITYNVPEDAINSGIFKLHMFMMRHAFNQPQVFNYLKLLYGNRAILSPDEIYKGSLFLSCFDQFKEKWGIIYDDVHCMFGSQEAIKVYKHRSFKEFVKNVRERGDVANSWYTPKYAQLSGFPRFDTKWENPVTVRNSPAEFREALKNTFEQYLKINEEETVRT
jgi:hypothetical protein